MGYALPGFNLMVPQQRLACLMPLTTCQNLVGLPAEQEQRATLPLFVRLMVSFVERRRLLPLYSCAIVARAACVLDLQPRSQV